MRTLSRLLLYVVLPGVVSGIVLGFAFLDSLTAERVLRAVLGQENAGAVLAKFGGTVDPAAIAIAAVLVVVGLVLLAIDLLRHRPGGTAKLP